MSSVPAHWPKRMSIAEYKRARDAGELRPPTGKGRSTRTRPDYKAEFMQQLRLAGLPEPAAEVRFHPTRKWRCDWMYIEKKIAIEYEGGVWTGGRHTRGKGYIADCEKYNALASLGFQLIRITADTVVSGEAVLSVERALEGLPF